MKRLLKAVPVGTLSVSIGLLTLGVCAYLFLLLAGRVLGDEAYAPLGTLWILVFLLGPAFLYPIEQELSRATAARRASNKNVAPVAKKAAILAVGISLILAVGIAIASPVLNDRMFDGDQLLLIGLVASIVSYAVAYVARGVFAGSERLVSYGVLIAMEGVVRLVAAVVLAIIGIDTPGAYGLAIGLGPLGAVAIALLVSKKSRGESGKHEEADWKEITASIGHLVAGGLFSQILVNGAPLVVKYLAGPQDQAQAGAFAKAVVITRIPLFLFQAVQAVTLPRLTKLATLGENEGFKRAFRQVMLLVGGIGLLGTIAAFALGSELLVLFGSDTGLPRRDITLLALGNALFLLDMTAAQALIALKAQGQTVVGWVLGVLALAAVVAVPGDVLLRVELGLIVGAAVSLAVMLVLLRGQLQRVSAGVEDLVEALEPSQSHMEL